MRSIIGNTVQVENQNGHTISLQRSKDKFASNTDIETLKELAEMYEFKKPTAVERKNPTEYAKKLFDHLKKRNWMTNDGRAILYDPRVVESRYQ